MTSNLSLVLFFGLGVLASFRLTELLVHDTIFQPLREWFGVGHDIDGNSLGATEYKGRVRYFIARLLSCTDCASVWTSGAVTLILLPQIYNEIYTPNVYFIFALAMAGVTMILSRFQN